MEDTPVQGEPDSVAEADAAPAEPPVAWPDSDFASRTGFEAARQRPADAPEPAQEAPKMVVEPSAPPKKPTKLMADLAAAIRATTVSARDQQMGQLEAEASTIVETIRAQSEEGAVALRRKSDEDVAGIRDWAKAEIARIKETSESRIGDRKHVLEQEVADHAAAIEDRCAEVHSTVAGYRRAMDAYFERLQTEDDPARLATMAEAMPEPPALQTLSDLDDLPIEGAAARRAAEDAEFEAAAESAETAEAAADVAETAAELLSGRVGEQDSADPEAQAALSARVDAGGFDTESYQDRLASLLPGHAEGGADGEPRTTQVIVTGLVSVASIASFKRHLGRLSGVTNVAVASGPDGEFNFNVTHRPDVSFRDAIPTMPGFAARVVASGDGVISVTAHDPEAES